MRESLRQLTLTLALPTAVIAVWAARGEPAGSAARELATPYGVELAELPLPKRERLRPPGSGVVWQAPRATAEDPSLRPPRPLLSDPSPPAPPPVAFGAEAAPAIGIADAPSPRPAAEPPGVAPDAIRPALRSGIPVLVAAGAAVGPQRAAPYPAMATGSAAPAQSAPESRIASPAAPTTGAKPGAGEPAASAHPGSAKAVRIASTPSFRPISGTPSGKNLAKGFSIADYLRNTPFSWRANHAPIDTPTDTGRVGSDESRGQGRENPNDRPLFTPAGPAWDPAIDLSLGPEEPEPAVELPDLPLQALETPAASHAFGRNDDFSGGAAPVLVWLASPSPTFKPIPEPGSALLVGAALAGVAAARRRRTCRASARGAARSA